ncbi:MAG: diguanylate cyclase [Chloroflexota bacterium]
MMEESGAAVQLNSEIMLPVMDALPFGILILDETLRVLTLNTFMRQRLAVEPGEAAPYDVDRILGERSARTRQVLEQAVVDGQPVTMSARFNPAIFNLRPLPGSPAAAVSQTVTIVPVGGGDRARGLVVTVQDVSDRLAVEADLKHEIAKLVFLHELDVSSSTLDLDAGMRALVVQVRRLFQADFAAVLVAKDGRLTVLAADGLALPEQFTTFDLERGLTGWTYRNARPVLTGEAARDARYVAFSDEIRSEMTVPLIAQGACIGVIDLESKAPAAFSRSDLTMLQLAASSAANALYNAQTHAQTDSWRTYFQGVLNQTGDVIYTVDSRLRLTHANSAWDQFAHENNGEAWLSAQISGRDLLDAFSGSEQEKWRSLCSELLDGRRALYSENIPCHSGRQMRWLKLRAAPLIGGENQIEGIIFSTQDITGPVQAERSLRQSNSQMETLLRFSQELSQTMSGRNIAEVAVDLLADVLQADCVTITYLDPAEKVFRVIAAHGASQRHVLEFRSTQAMVDVIINQYGMIGTVYNLANSIRSLNQEIYLQDGLHSLLYAVISRQGQPVGSINVFVRSPQRRFSTSEEELLIALTPQIGLAMENARMVSELRSLATTDGLTGLSSRRELDHLLAREMERCERYHRSFSVLMIDLDHFKCYNDTFGHAVGDELLRQLAAKFNQNLRRGDVAARYGGDEFTILLPETGVHGAVTMARRLQKLVGELELLADLQGPCEPLSLSVGVASCMAEQLSPAELLRRADQALYRAKQLGRDRIEIFNPEGD